MKEIGKIFDYQALNKNLPFLFLGHVFLFPYPYSFVNSHIIQMFDAQFNCPDERKTQEVLFSIVIKVTYKNMSAIQFVSPS